ncbi:pyridoxal phosphate-dependent aminotransferase [Isobaculum melis]|nr:pyridoxal phosphate-dependent aminotransferase [Isobaculum melis]
MSPSATFAIAAKAKKLKDQGIDILSLSFGEPDFVTPKSIQEGAIRAIESGAASFYTPSAGLPQLKEAICAETLQTTGVKYAPTETIVTDGAKYALYLLFQVLLNTGDEVLIPAPYWVSYPEQVKLAEGQPVFVETHAATKYKVTVADLEAKRTVKTKALVINTPSNPTGMIYTKEELTAIGNWAVQHDILIVADDIYGKLVYNGYTSVSIVSMSEAIKKQTILINGVSKSYAMTGWRIGYALGNETIIQRMTDLASHSTSNPSAVAQYAAIEALTGSQQSTEEMRQAFETRLNQIYPLLMKIPGVTCEKPEGAFYLFPDVSETAKLCGYSNVTDFASALLEQAHVAVVPGIGFGAPDNIRLSYAADLLVLEAAMKRIHDFVIEKMK